MKKDYLLLLARRESKEMLGYRMSNLWILTAVLIVAFAAVAFSWAGKKYLEYKMSDPFTNWVNIANEYGKGNYESFFSDLGNEELREKYQISSVSGDDYLASYFIGADGKEHFLECRFFGDFEGNLVKAVLDRKNVVEGCAAPLEEIGNKSYGLIITVDALKKLGYDEDNIPAFISVSNPAGDDTSLGLKMHEFEGSYYTMDPMPLLGVVKSLPMNMDLIGSHYWYIQYNDDVKDPFFINDRKYFARDQLYYFVEEGKDSMFVKTVQGLTDSSGRKPRVVFCEEGLDAFRPWKKGNFYQVMYGSASSSVMERASFDHLIQDAVEDMNAVRIFNYVEAQSYDDNNYLYYSVNFRDLKSIIEFEKYVKEHYNIQLEISQVTSKQNFRVVSMIANVLTFVMIAFAIFCIVMYIINMLQGYFQKVKRNIGTFKAFGMESDSLIKVYVATLLLIVVIAIVVSYLVTGFVGIMLKLCGFIWETGFPYLILFNLYTIITIMIVAIATVLTVYVVMRKMLHQTPGDLIYDR